MTAPPDPIRAPRGPALSCRGWQQEAALRMLMNNLDPEVAERPEDLVVYGGTGKAARDWAAYDAIVRALRTLGDDETLLVQSGKPVGVFTTNPGAPRVLIANGNLVPRWADWSTFRELERQGLTMYGQMTAGSWIYIGTQGILQGTYETLGSVARQNFAGTLQGTWTLTGGMGGMGGAQPLAVTMNGGAVLVVEVDPARIERRVRTGYCARMTGVLDEAVEWILDARSKGEALSVGLVGNCAEVLPELLRRDVVPDVLTDQTSAHDALNGYVPARLALGDAQELRRRDPDEYVRRSMASMRVHCEAMVGMMRRGAVTFDYGNNLRGQALDAGFADAFAFPGFVPAYIRSLFCQGKGPFRWVALSGDPADIHRTDDLVLELFPHDDHLRRWNRPRPRTGPVPGAPRQDLLARAGRTVALRRGAQRPRRPRRSRRAHRHRPRSSRHRLGRLAVPRDRAMRDGSDAIADWPILNALLNVASGASWVSFHHGGGVGIGNSLHAGQVLVADGTPEMAGRIERVLTNDPGLGVARHADTGYEEALETARIHGIRLPGREGRSEG